MFGKVKFRMVVDYDLELAKAVSALLGSEGIKVYDVLETDIQNTFTKDKVKHVYLLCCRGKNNDYKRLIHKHKMNVNIQNGIRFLY